MTTTTRPISFGADADREISTLAAETGVSQDALRTVYRRGAATFTASHREGVTRSAWAMARCHAFTHLVQHGRPANSAYTSDNDLLPPEHPRARPVTAASALPRPDELAVSLPETNTFAQPEDAILALTEYSGLGYDAEPAIRASWMRALRNGEDGYRRASMAASLTYDSLDADLLPEPMMEGDLL